MEKKVVDVAVAIITNKDNQVLLTRRNNSQSFAGMWEFPGGKVEANESFKEAVIREVFEELNVDILFNNTFEYASNYFEYDDFIANIKFFKTSLKNQTPILTDQLEMKWVDIESLTHYQFPSANNIAVDKLILEDKVVKAEMNISNPVSNTKLIHNHTDEQGNHHKVLSTIIDNLLECTSFKIVTAFITESGVSMLLPTLKVLEARGVKGQIITGTYLNFTHPTAVSKLNSFSNIEVLLNGDNLHTKCYIFEGEKQTKVLLGSSNITASALTTNIEWNNLTTYSSLPGNDNLYLNQINSEFVKIAEQSSKLDDVIDEYINMYNNQKLDNINIQTNNQEIKANSMQIAALDSLEKLRKNSLDKGLVVSSTGSGKTILAALDVKQASPDRMLFVVHRENIARKAMDTFKQIMPNKSYGLYTGTSKDRNSDYIFATIQTLVNNLDSFNTNDFDYIIIDEVHHGGAKSYQRVFNYFKPSFYLGLTATPERMDNFNIFEMFDYNLAYEYNLNDAMNDNLLAPFHYFGVSDITVDDQLVDDNTTINNLTDKMRIKNIKDKLIEYTVTNKVNGLMFVSNTNEAKELSTNLNNLGFKTISLDSSNSEADREAAIARLETDELEYIITVDIFNEGIDIPAVNQVVLLRPTKSAIVYIQQLGRGLRKSKDKEFVTIIDFIGNYKNNYLIPVAISNDHSYNKDKLKRDVIVNGVELLQGESIIQFEQQLQRDLINQITSTKISQMSKIRQDYNYLKSKLNRVPTLLDFEDNGLISPTEIVKLDIYPKLVSKIEKISNNLSEDQELYLEYISKYVLTSKRKQEATILSQLMDSSTLTIRDEIERNAAMHLAREIFTKISDEYKYKPILNQVSADEYELTIDFKQALQTKQFKDNIQDMLTLNSKYTTNSGLVKYNTYTRKDAYKLLLKDFNNGYQVSGYTVFEDMAIMFITLDDSNSFTSYSNELLDSKTITWFSKKNRKLTKNNKLTQEGMLAQNKVPIHILAKRTTSEEFYYLGTAKTINTETIQVNNEDTRIKYFYQLQSTIQDKTYKYLIK